MVWEGAGLTFGRQFLQERRGMRKALEMERVFPSKPTAEGGRAKRRSRGRPGDAGALEGRGHGRLEDGVPLVKRKTCHRWGVLDAFHERRRECTQGMGFREACLSHATAKDRGNLREALHLTLLISVHRDEDPQRFFRGVSVQPTKWMCVPMFVVHGELSLHVSLFRQAHLLSHHSQSMMQQKDSSGASSPPVATRPPDQRSSAPWNLGMMSSPGVWGSSAVTRLVSSTKPKPTGWSLQQETAEERAMPWPARTIMSSNVVLIDAHDVGPRLALSNSHEGCWEISTDRL